MSCGLDPVVGDSLLNGDTDALTNLAEFVNGADPCDPDTDADGRNDTDVVLYGSDPAVANGVPVSSCSSPEATALNVVQVSFSNW